MNRVPRLLPVSAALLLLFALCACASTAPVATGVRAPTPGMVVSDDAYMAAVNAKAMRRGVEVHWVNPPVKRVPQQQ